MTEQWYAGRDEEWFSLGPFDSREAVIAEGRESWPDRHFFIGISGEHTPFTRDFVEELIELEACDVSDHCGPDASDNWPPRLDRKSDEYKAANEKIAAIMRDLCGDCSVFPISNTERVEKEQA